MCPHLPLILAAMRLFKDFKLLTTVAAPLQAAATIQKLHFWPSNYYIKST